jgi:hypothetical protein
VTAREIRRRLAAGARKGVRYQWGDPRESDEVALEVLGACEALPLCWLSPEGRDRFCVAYHSEVGQRALRLGLTANRVEELR